MESVLTLLIIVISIIVSIQKNKSKQKPAMPKPFTPYQHSEASRKQAPPPQKPNQPVAQPYRPTQPVNRPMQQPNKPTNPVNRPTQQPYTPPPTARPNPYDMAKNVTPAKQSVSQTVSANQESTSDTSDFKKDFLTDSGLLSTNYMDMGMTLWTESPCIKEIEDLIVTGYPVKLPTDRDFLAEGLALVEAHLN